MSNPYEFTNRPNKVPSVVEDPFVLEADLIVCFLPRQMQAEQYTLLNRAQIRLGENALKAALNAASPSTETTPSPVSAPAWRADQRGPRNILFVYDDPAVYVGAQVGALLANLTPRKDQRITLVPPGVIDPTSRQDFAHAVEEAVAEAARYEQDRAGDSPISVDVILPNTPAAMDYLRGAVYGQ